MRLFNRVAIAPVLLLLVSQIAFAQFQYPRSGGALNDFASKLTPTIRQRLETTVIEFQRRSGVDLRVVTIPQSDLRGRPIEQYSMGLARLWAVGRSSGGRGLLLVVAIGSPDKKGIYHGATRLEVSRSLERDIPNKLAGELTSRIRESLMAGWFDEALTIGVDGVTSAIDQKQRETSQNNARGMAAPSSPPHSQSLPVAERSRTAPDIFGFVLILLALGVPAIIIAAIIRGIARSTGPGSPAGGNRRTRRRGGIGLGTGIALSGTDWSNRDSSNSVSMDSTSAAWIDSTSTSSWTESSSSASTDSSSSWTESSSSASSDSSSSWTESSSSASSDSSSSSSSGGDFGGGGSTDSW